jgi:sugar (pentulose or hexulose) kinase
MPHKPTRVQGASSVLAKWLWLAECEAATVERAEHLLLGAHAYVAYQLTGGAVACDRTTASTTGLLAPWSHVAYCSRILKELDLDERKLPPVLEAAAVLGTVQPAAAQQLGLPQLAGVPVIQVSE